MAKWEHDDWVTVQPYETKIACKDCYFREPDRKASDTVTIKGCTLGICKVFQVAKPSEVMFDNEPCPYYLNENEDEEEG